MQLSGFITSFSPQCPQCCRGNAGSECRRRCRRRPGPASHDLHQAAPPPAACGRRATPAVHRRRAAEHHGVEGESLSSTAAKTHAPCFSYTAQASFSLSAAIPPYTNSSTAAAAATPPSAAVVQAVGCCCFKTYSTKRHQKTEDDRRPQQISAITTLRTTADLPLES